MSDETKAKIEDGGPAFAQPWHPEMGYSPRETPPGMSLRDYFAIHAPPPSDFMQKHLSAMDHAMTMADKRCVRCDRSSEILEAQYRYKFADAMLSVRKNPNP